MRKIKFRAYDTLRNEYLSEGQILLSIKRGERPNDGVQYLDVISDHDKYEDRFILEEYTGYCDKNGVEVFEGDIILNHLNNIYVVMHYGGNLILSDEYGMPWNDFTLVGISLKYMDYKIIGNIHDNPELLKGGEQ